MRSASAGSRTLGGSGEAGDPRENRAVAGVGAVAELVAQAEIKIVGGGNGAFGAGRVETEPPQAGRCGLDRAGLDALPPGTQVVDPDQDDLRSRQALKFL
jgi:hypothetical protein